MATINFLYPENSEIKYHIDNFPDGHKHLVIDSELNKRESIKIVTRLTTMDDLFILLQAKDIFDRHLIFIPHLKISYLISSRMDRVMDFNQACDLKVILEILKCNFVGTAIEIFELHNIKSDINLTKSDFTESLFMDELQSVYNMIDKSKVYIFPDKGASERYAWIKLNNTTICASKERIDGKIKISLPEFDINDDQELIVMDDLCDGGGTFFAIHAILPKKYQDRVHLIVGHVIQYDAIVNLAKLYKSVTITNSFKNWDKYKFPENVTVLQLYTNE